jgi:putative salt-induced outer membrane protein YdiY
MKRSLAFLSVVIAALCGSVMADQVTLKNGDRLTGDIVKADATSLVLKTQLVGEVTIPWDAVTGLKTDKTLYVTLADGSTKSGLVSGTGDQFEIHSAAGQAISTTKSSITSLRSEAEQAEYLRHQNPGWRELWTGNAHVGFAITSGNSRTTNIATGLGLTRETPRDKTIVYVASVYAKDKSSGVSQTTANIIRGGLRYDRDINKKWFGYGAADFEHNELQNLSLRIVPGGGLGYHAIKSERTQLDVLGGGDWNKEFFSGIIPDRSSAEVQVGETLSHKFNPRVTLREQFFIFPNLSETGEYRMNLDTSVTADITRRIAVSFTLSDRYLSNAPIGTEKNDLLMTTGISFKLGGQK